MRHFYSHVLLYFEHLFTNEIKANPRYKDMSKQKCLQKQPTSQSILLSSADAYL